MSLSNHSKYYDDLSGADSDDASSDSEHSASSFLNRNRKKQPPAQQSTTTSTTTKNKNHNKAPSPNTTPQQRQQDFFKSHHHYQQQPDRIILHLDVDCFYCQCEHIDRKIDRNQPLAIGQKHIIVTCNYAARQQLGLTKLSSRQEAKDKYPSLLIVDGSDLERYRRYARRIYVCFRNTIKEICNSVAVCKGSMDEMMADLTPLVNNEEKCDDTIVSNQDTKSRDIYIYGENGLEETTVLTEDQSGASTTVVHKNNDTTTNPTLPNYTDAQMISIRQRLYKAAMVAWKIRQMILEQTGFTTTLGLSVNPFLCKIASGLRKPGHVNILYPWDCHSLILPMPLRKIPGLGSRTMKALVPCLQQHHQDVADINHNKTFWTCADLLKVPPTSIQACLEKVSSYEKSSAQQCELILNKCRGVDNSPVIDDHGGLAKTVSVENSFRRGTVRNKDHVYAAMDDLYKRLPPILNERIAWSLPQTTNSVSTTGSSKPYPQVMRLTVRFVKGEQSTTGNNSSSAGTKRRSHETKSQQTPFDGRKLVNEPDVGKQKSQIQQIASPLLDSLVFAGNHRDNINITRINIAVSNFNDTVIAASRAVPAVSSLRFFSKSAASEQSQTTTTITTTTTTPAGKQSGEKRNVSTLAGRITSSSSSSPHDSKSNFACKPKYSQQSPNRALSIPRFGDIDPAVLAELPEDIANEIRRAARLGTAKKRKGGNTKINDFFTPSCKKADRTKKLP